MNKPFYGNIEDMTLKNSNYREVLYTSKKQQLVIMSILPRDTIPLETHKDVDQFIRVETGSGIATIDGVEYLLSDGFSIIIPAGSSHQVVNNGTKPLKLYSIYSPPEHPTNTVHVSNPNKSKYKLKKN